MFTITFPSTETLRMKTRYFLFAALLMAALPACKSNKNNGASGDQGGAYAGDSDRVNGTPLSNRDEGVSFLDPSVSKSRFRPVHFAFDSFNLAPEDAQVVRQVADFMQSGSNKVIVAGFCDERGTPDYNRAFGEKRAGAVREALIGNGVDPSRIQTVSFGAEMPVDPASNEDAWAKNRRAEFGVTK